MPWGFEYQHIRTPAERWGRAARANWARSTAILLAALVILLPLIALLVTAIVVGVVAYILLSLLAALMGAVAGILRALGVLPEDPAPNPRSDGRENVRVIR